MALYQERTTAILLIDPSDTLCVKDKWAINEKSERKEKTNKEMGMFHSVKGRPIFKSVWGNFQIKEVALQTYKRTLTLTVHQWYFIEN